MSDRDKEIRNNYSAMVYHLEQGLESLRALARVDVLSDVTDLLGAAFEKEGTLDVTAIRAAVEAYLKQTSDE